jgi:ubiquinone/menaquinone biosynthesis C-methylase UbiE
VLRKLIKRMRAEPMQETDESGELMPPPKLQALVGQTYKEVGAEFLGHLTKIAGLKPDETILDVGCGCGRMAVPLTRYLTTGQYHGFDVPGESIDWCIQAIPKRFPNFHFKTVDLHNGVYNRKGKLKPSEFKFPYPDAMFDVALFASVFTHLFPPDAQNYVAQLARVLKPGGRALCTFFLLNDESKPLIEAKKGVLNFEYQEQGYRTIRKDMPEMGIAYEESFIRDLFAKHGLKVEDPIHYGFWCGRAQHLSMQDILLVTKIG